MRWIFLAATLAAIVLTVLSPSAGWMALGLVVTLLGLLLTAFAFAHNRIDASARSEELNSYELELLRKRMHEKSTGDDDTSDT